MILIDLHEPESVLKGLGKLGCKVQLAVGDYLFFTVNREKVIVERKAISDLLNSLRSGRLQEQVRNTITHADVPILLVEGFMTSTKEGRIRHKAGVSKWRYNAMQNFLMTAQLAGMYVLHSPNTFFTPQILKSLFAYFQKEEHESLRKRPRSIVLYPAGDRERQKDLLATIPGIGPELAGRLLERFESPLAVFVASDEDLLEVSGVGKKKVEMMRKMIGEGARK